MSPLRADASGDTSKLRAIAADPRFSEGDRAKVAAQADKIDAREAAKAEKEAADARAKRQQDIEELQERGWVDVDKDGRTVVVRLRPEAPKSN